MKLSGYDQIIITGRADTLLYCLITNSDVRFVDCPELAGTSLIQTTKTIRQGHKDYAIQVAAIGQAGENQVHFAAIVSSGNRVNGRIGMGAVMGSKNLKALAVRGSRSLELAESLAFLEETKKIESAILQHNEYPKRYALGTTMLMTDLNDIGILPTKHFKEGVCTYVDEISGQKLVMQVKGLDIICGDPRGIKAYGLTYAIASRGGDHLRAEPFFELTNRKDEARERFGTEKAANRLAEEGKAALVTYSEKISLLTDALTMCKNIGLCMDILNLENASALLKAGTGIDYKPEYLYKTLGDAINRDYELNTKFGIKKEDNTLPERFQTEPLTRGPTEGPTVDIQRMFNEYYKLHNWE